MVAQDAGEECERDDGDAFERPRPRPDDERAGRGEPAVRVALDEPEHDGRQAERERDEARRVEAGAPVLVARLGDPQERGHERHDADREVDQERPPPGDVGGEPAAEERPEGGHAADHGAVDGEGDRPLAAAERGVEDGLCRGRDGGTADTLEHAGAEEEWPGRGEAGEQRAAHERHEAEDVQAPTAEDVPGPTEGDQEGGEDERVDRDDPLGARCVEAEVPYDGRDGHVHDGGVHDDHRDAETERDQGQPAGSAEVHGGVSFA
jgi:hypothetical protein